MFKRYIDMHLKYAKEKKKTSSRLIALFVAVTLFLVVFPILLILIGQYVIGAFPIAMCREIEIAFALFSIVVGLFFYTWTNIVQWKIGKGTIAISAPTQALVISGPYKLCRNPLELGAIFYYLGIGTLIESLEVGIFMFIIMFVVGSLYHKHIEEKELELRFGDAYIEYKKNTPFIIPKLLKNVVTKLNKF